MIFGLHQTELFSGKKDAKQWVHPLPNFSLVAGAGIFMHYTEKAYASKVNATDNLWFMVTVDTNCFSDKGAQI